MRRWREKDTGIVHSYDPGQSTTKHKLGAVQMHCGEPMKLRTYWDRYQWALITQVPSGKRLTDELPSVKTLVTCIGCLSEAKP